MPQWVETSAHPRGNLSWNLTTRDAPGREVHLLRRVREGLPRPTYKLNLVNQKLVLTVIEDSFKFRSGYDEKERPSTDDRLQPGGQG